MAASPTVVSSASATTSARKRKDPPGDKRDAGIHDARTTTPSDTDIDAVPVARPVEPAAAAAVMVRRRRHPRERGAVGKGAAITIGAREWADTTAWTAHYQTTQYRPCADAAKLAGTLENGRVYVGVSALPTPTPMLGLFAGVAYEPDDVVTEYGGLFRDADEVRAGPKEFVSHTCRIPGSSQVRDGRDMALCFQPPPSSRRVSPSSLLPATSHSVSAVVGARHTVTPTLPSLPPLPSSSSSSSLVWSTLPPAASASRMSLPLSASLGRGPPVTWKSVPEWPSNSRWSLELEPRSVMRHIRTTGLGYMCNYGAHDIRNVKWKHVKLSRSGIALPALVLVARRRIDVGEEIICAYNNEETRAHKRSLAAVASSTTTTTIADNS